MLIKLFLLFVFLILIKRSMLLGQKAVQDKFDITWYNKDYLENPKFTLANYNSSTDIKICNASYVVKQDLPNVIIINVQVYKKTNNDYLVFPMNFTGDMCPMYAKDTPEIKEMLKKSNMKPCPIKKGSYYMYNMVMEQRKVPLYIPTGSYMAESTTSIENNIKLMITRFYARVVRE